jgi:hypothetical protein
MKIKKEKCTTEYGKGVDITLNGEEVNKNTELDNSDKKSHIYDVIHSYLEKPKFRAVVLLPPLTLCIIGAIIVFIHAYSNFCFEIPPLIQWTFFGGAIWLLLSMCVVLWSDYKR